MVSACFADGPFGDDRSSCNFGDASGLGAACSVALSWRTTRREGFRGGRAALIALIACAPRGARSSRFLCFFEEESGLRASFFFFEVLSERNAGRLRLREGEVIPDCRRIRIYWRAADGGGAVAVDNEDDETFATFGVRRARCDRFAVLLLVLRTRPDSSVVFAGAGGGREDYDHGHFKVDEDGENGGGGLWCVCAFFASLCCWFRQSLAVCNFDVSVSSQVPAKGLRRPGPNRRGRGRGGVRREAVAFAYGAVVGGSPLDSWKETSVARSLRWDLPAAARASTAVRCSRTATPSDLDAARRYVSVVALILSRSRCSSFVVRGRRWI